jgi:CubicO group peptidase (beta-lactamase class C family)
MFARARDLLALGSSLLGKDNRTLHPSTLAASIRPQTAGLTNLNPDPVIAATSLWGLSWNLQYQTPALLERNVYGHGGWSGCQWWIYPEHDACFVFLTNALTPTRGGVNLNNLHNAFGSGLVGSPA